MNKIRFMIGFGELVDLFYIKAVLIKKALVKKIFVLDIEHSQEVYIPDLLSCDLYPRSFRYYDPIISITNKMFSNKSRVFHALRTDHNLKKNQRQDFKKMFLEKFGLIQNDKKLPMQFKHQVLKTTEKGNVNLFKTQHSFSLQKSRFLMIESTEKGLQRLADLQ